MPRAKRLMLSVYPWQQPQWQRLLAAAATDRLPHALLLSGPPGIGLAHFAQCLSGSLLCLDATQAGLACGRCKACTLYAAGNHPDTRQLVPEDKGKQIKVDAVRALIDYIHLSSQYGRHKVAVIDPAEAMNRSAANSLLKTLEEPPAGSLLILIAHQPSLLPVTIRSRCQHIKFPAADDEQARNWLQKQSSINRETLDDLLSASRGAPLKALEMAATDMLAQQRTILADLAALKQGRIDPVSTAEKWQGFGIAEVLSCLVVFFAEMSRLLLAPSPSAYKATINKDLQALTNGLDLDRLLRCYDTTLKSYHSVSGPISLNKQGLLEEIIIQWQSHAVGGS